MNWIAGISLLLLFGCSNSTRSPARVTTNATEAGDTADSQHRADAAVLDARLVSTDVLEPDDAVSVATVEDSATTASVEGIVPQQLSASRTHACLFTHDGRAYCAEPDALVALATSTTPATDTAWMSDIEEVAAGSTHHCVRNADHTVSCAGGNGSGQSGQPASPSLASLTRLEASRNVIGITAGDTFSCALLPTGYAQCWGWIGQVPAPIRRLNRKPWEPYFVHGIDSLVQLVAGRAHVCGINRYGIARCWGDNNRNQLGDNTTTRADRPVRVLHIADAASLVAGENHTCELERDATVRCWGDNEHGQIGDGTTQARGRATTVTPLANITSLGAAGRRTCARSNTGDVYCWGLRGNDPSIACSSAPTACDLTPRKIEALHGVEHVMPVGKFDCGWSEGTALRCVQM